MPLELASAVIFGESRGTRDHILLSQIRDFNFCRLLRLAGLRWRYSTPPPHRGLNPLATNFRFIASGRTPWKTRATCYQDCVFTAPLPSIGQGADHIQNTSVVIVKCLVHATNNERSTDRKTPLLYYRGVLPSSYLAMGFPSSIAEYFEQIRHNTMRTRMAVATNKLNSQNFLSVRLSTEGVKLPIS
jgi:hypothetical protein